VPRVKTRQQIAKEQTRQTIIEAAARLFAEHGYTSTSIGQIASEAGVAVQTIYNSVGGKREILSRVLDFAAAGERAPSRPAQFLREQAERESDPRMIIAQLIDFWRDALPRTAPVFRMIREAAAGDPEAAALEHERAAQRLRNYRHAAQLLADLGALRAGLTPERAAATIFAIGHPDSYRALVLDGEWDTHTWASWALDALTGALIDPAAAGPSPDQQSRGQGRRRT
jgi:AcrR family transcriptional regulator